jgi:phospholipase/carboxylesterase
MDYLDCVEVATGDQPDTSVIWLHGLGASGHDFEPVVPHLGLPESAAVRFVFPHAPEIPVTINGGMVMPAWYDIRSLDRSAGVDEERIQASSRATRDLIEREIERGVDSRRIIVAGFSQGGAIAYHTALTYEQPLAGLMALSSYFATPHLTQPGEANRDLPVFIAHGSQDPMLSEALGRQSMEHVQQLGYEPEYRTYAMGHEVCMDEIRDIGVWLRSVLGYGS